jgi:plasmid stabilization system protein ParE
MKAHMLGPAERELEETVAYYDSFAQETGDRFLEDYRRTLDFIVRWPNASPRVARTRNARRCRLSHFPYRIIYQVFNQRELVVVAVAHTKRRLTYWRNRLQ